MFGISMWELVLIVLVALILLGPRQLTETARVVGKLYRELLRLTSEVKETINLDTLSEMSTPKYEPPPPKQICQESLPKPRKFCHRPEKKQVQIFMQSCLSSLRKLRTQNRELPREKRSTSKNSNQKKKLRRGPMSLRSEDRFIDEQRHNGR